MSKSIILSSKDESVSGVIIGDIQFQGRLYYDGRSQSQAFCANSEHELKAQASCLLDAKKAEHGHLFKEIWPLDIWELRIS